METPPRQPLVSQATGLLSSAHERLRLAQGEWEAQPGSLFPEMAEARDVMARHLLSDMQEIRERLELFQRMTERWAYMSRTGIVPPPSEPG